MLEKIIKKDKISVKTDIATGIQILKEIDKEWKNLGYEVYKTHFESGDGVLLMIKDRPTEKLTILDGLKKYFEGIKEEDILNDPSILLQKLESRIIYPDFHSCGENALGITQRYFDPAELDITYDNKKPGHFPSIRIKDGYGLKYCEAWGDHHLYGLGRKEEWALKGYKWDKISMEFFGEDSDLNIARKIIREYK